MVLWTIFVLPIEENDVKEVEIDSEKTFGEFRRKVADILPNISSNDLIFTADKEYNYEYNSKKMSEINGIFDQMTLYAVYQVNGGKKAKRFKNNI